MTILTPEQIEHERQEFIAIVMERGYLRNIAEQVADQWIADGGIEELQRTSAMARQMGAACAAQADKAIFEALTK